MSDHDHSSEPSLFGRLVAAVFTFGLGAVLYWIFLWDATTYFPGDKWDLFLAGLSVPGLLAAGAFFSCD